VEQGQAQVSYGDTIYSREYAGNSRNHNLSVSFDKTDGYVRISQTDNGGKLDVVLLTPKQFKALVSFVAKKGTP
jgi:hypothetical protein